MFNDCAWLPASRRDNWEIEITFGFVKDRFPKSHLRDDKKKNKKNRVIISLEL